MQKIRIVEKFDSIQGEGEFVGTPSVFVRVFGCNFECSAFGQPRVNRIAKEDMPHNKFDLTKINSIEELPVFDIGCDSSAAWSKKYRHLCFEQTVDDLYDSLNLDGGYEQKHLVITGGEPLLKKHQKFWAEFFDKYKDIKNVTFETNGTQELTTKLRNVMDAAETCFTFSISPKLSLSGESIDKALVPSAISSYDNCGIIYLKFVIRDEEDIGEVKLFTNSYLYTLKTKKEINWNTRLDVYLMPEGATVEGLKLTERNVADLAMKYGYKYSPRLHCQLFGNSWGT